MKINYRCRNVVALTLSVAIFQSPVTVLAWGTSQSLLSPGLLRRNQRRQRRGGVRSHTPEIAAASSAAAASAKRKSATEIETMKPRLDEEGRLKKKKSIFGVLNPYSVYYGIVIILFAIPWYVSLTACQALYALTGDGFDKLRRLPMVCTHVWHFVTLQLSRCTPEIVNQHILREYLDRRGHKAAMIVANHNSFLDVQFISYAMGWRSHYKFVAKKELGKVPVLGKAIREGANIMVDRSNRRSQLLTLKSGIRMLKNGVHLCTFPEGTRSRTGKVLPFKRGAFKMAYKVGAPIIPMSIVGTSHAFPPHCVLPRRPAAGLAKVIVHEPIEPHGKTEQELTDAVREKILSGLPKESSIAKNQ